MCGRFTQDYTWAEVHDFLDLRAEPPRNLRARYNIAPSTTVDVVRATEAGRELGSMRWGLVPGWWKKPLKELPATFNSRAESVAEKPMFREAFRRRRCIIPISGFYEWTGEKKARQPHYFTAADGAPVMAVAGLWDRWRDPEGEEVLSCTMVVTEAHAWMQQFHDRIPAFLAPESFGGWLDGSLGTEVLQPAEVVPMREWLVDRRMNVAGVGDDDPATAAPLAPDAPPAGQLI